MTKLTVANAPKTEHTYHDRYNVRILKLGAFVTAPSLFFGGGGGWGGGGGGFVELNILCSVTRLAYDYGNSI